MPLLAYVPCARHWDRHWDTAVSKRQEIPALVQLTFSRVDKIDKL